MKINKSTIALVYLFSVSSVALTTNLYADTTLHQSLEQTMATNPDIMADKAAAKSSEYGINQARAGYFPKVDLTATAGHEYVKNKYETNSCATGVSCRQNKFRTNPSVAVVQNVFDGLKTPRDVAKATSEQLQAQMKLMETRELVAYRAINAASDVRRFQRLYRLANENIAAHERILGKVNKLIDGGRASVADRHSVSSRLNDAKSAAVDILGDLNSAIARYRAIVGVEPDRLASTAVPDSYVPASLDEALSLGRDRNRSVVLAKTALEVAKAELSSVDTAFLPTVSIEADASHAKNTAGRDGFTNNLQVLGVVRYNIFSGGRDLARSNQASERVSQSRYRLESAMRSAEEEIRRSWAERESARMQAIDLRKSVSDKAEVRTAFLKQYDLGSRTLLDVLDSENDYFLTKGSLITVDATQDLTEARLLASMGILLEKFGISDNMPEMAAATAELAYAIDTKDPQEEWLTNTTYMTDEQANAAYSEASSERSPIEEATISAAPISNEEKQNWANESNTLPAGVEVYDFDAQTVVKGQQPASAWKNPNTSSSPSRQSEPKYHDFDKSQPSQAQPLAYDSGNTTASQTAQSELAAAEATDSKSWWEELTSWSADETTNQTIPEATPASKAEAPQATPNSETAAQETSTWETLTGFFSDDKGAAAATEVAQNPAPKAIEATAKSSATKKAPTPNLAAKNQPATQVTSISAKQAPSASSKTQTVARSGRNNDQAAYYDFDENRTVTVKETSQAKNTVSTSAKKTNEPAYHDFYADTPSWWTSLQPKE